MNKIIILLLAVASAVAQNTDVIYEPKNLTGDRANRAVNFVREIMLGRATVLWEPVLRQAVLRGGKDEVAQALQLLQKYDVPDPRNQRTYQVEYTIHLVGAFNSERPNRGVPMPAELADVVKQMKGSLLYKDFRLLETIPLVVQGHSTEYSGILSTSAVGTSQRYFYKCSVSFPTVRDDGKTVGSESFTFFVTIPEKAGEVGIRTQLVIKEGQKVVLGKIKLDGSDDAVFLVITVKLL
jgi:hypothetical protein